MKISKKSLILQKALGYTVIASCFGGLSTSVLAQMASNPYGDVPPGNTSQDVNYSGINNMEARSKVQAPSPSNIPVIAPSGLPQSTQEMVSQQFNSNNIDQLDSTVTILNTPSDKIRKLNKDLYQKGRVINESPVAVPKSNNGMVVAHISPGSTSPVIRLFKNRTSTIIITDMAGQPWPILNYDGLSTEDFTVKRLDNPSPKGYVLSVTPRGAFVSGNLVLILKGLPTPVNLEFISAQKEVDVATEIRVQAKGPNSDMSSIGLPSSVDTALLSVLQGVAPANAKELKVSSNAVQAWISKDGSMYVRTRYKIMSPAFDNVTSSPDGTFAYKMVPVPVVLFKVADGRFGEFTVSGY